MADAALSGPAFSTASHSYPSFPGKTGCGRKISGNIVCFAASSIKSIQSDRVLFYYSFNHFKAGSAKRQIICKQPEFSPREKYRGLV
jgi:hypothetical protein